MIDRYLRWAVLVWMSLTGTLYAQPEIGLYTGELKVIDAPQDSMEQAKLLHMFFSVNQGYTHWRTDINNPVTGLIVYIGQKGSQEITAHFDFHGNKRKMIIHAPQANPSVTLHDELKWAEGDFEEAVGDTFLAGVPCKKVVWKSRASPKFQRVMWYAPLIPNAYPGLYQGIVGMPMLFEYEQGPYRMRYTITGVSIEPASPDLFLELTDYEELEPLKNEMIQHELDKK